MMKYCLLIVICFAPFLYFSTPTYAQNNQVNETITVSKGDLPSEVLRELEEKQELDKLKKKSNATANG